MTGIFAEWQPRYAEHGIATFPVRDKRPAVSNYLKMGLPASSQLAIKFPGAEGLGFACGQRSGITVLDVDAPDERLLADALDEFGPTPLIIRSGSGNHQLWFRHNGESRKIRPDPRRPLDILGGGYVVAPPSRGSKGDYAIIQGSLDDLERLPRLRLSQGPVAASYAPGDRVRQGNRNDALWKACMTHAPCCAGWEDLMGFAMKANQDMFYEPLPDDEVIKVVASAWAKEASGENFFGGRKGLIIGHDQLDRVLLEGGPDPFLLLTILKRHHWGREFVCANAMAETMPPHGWTRQRFAAARRKLEQIGEILMLRPAIKGVGPATYRFKGVEK